MTKYRSIAEIDTEGLNYNRAYNFFQETEYRGINGYEYFTGFTKRTLAIFVAMEYARKNRWRCTFEGEYLTPETELSKFNRQQTWAVRFERSSGAIAADVFVSVTDADVRFANEEFRYVTGIPLDTPCTV